MHLAKLNPKQNDNNIITLIAYFIRDSDSEMKLNTK